VRQDGPGQAPGADSASDLKGKRPLGPITSVGRPFPGVANAWRTRRFISSGLPFKRRAAFPRERSAACSPRALSSAAEVSSLARSISVNKRRISGGRAIPAIAAFRISHPQIGEPTSAAKRGVEPRTVRENGVERPLAGELDQRGRDREADLLHVSVLESHARLDDAVDRDGRQPEDELIRTRHVHERSRMHLIGIPEGVHVPPSKADVHIAPGREDAVEAAVHVGESVVPFVYGGERRRATLYEAVGQPEKA
jgi:hypothetical protein